MGFLSGLRARRLRALAALAMIIPGTTRGAGPGPERSTPTSGGTPTREAGGPLPALVLLAPGTRIDRTAPEGWSHLVVKSVPRLASGDLESLPEIAGATATLFRMVILADVRPVAEGSGRHLALRRVGLGLCTPLRGHDTVITSQGLEAQGADLGFVARTVLERGEQELRRGRLLARTPTFALFSTPAVMRVGASHRDVLLRYALLVDPATGALRTLVWSISADPTTRAPARTMVLVQQGVVSDCPLDVAADRLLGALPVSWSFAIQELPPGQARPIPPDLQPWSVRDARSPAEACQFEGLLRRSLSAPIQRASR